MTDSNYDAIFTLVNLQDIQSEVLEAYLNILRFIHQGRLGNTFTPSKMALGYDPERHLVYAYNEQLDFLIWDWDKKIPVMYYDHPSKSSICLYAEVLDKFNSSASIESDGFLSLPSETA